MTEPTSDAGTATDATADGAASSGNQPDYKALCEAAQVEAADWKKRFTGLQGTYQRELLKWQDATKRVSELEATLAGADDHRKTLVAEIETLRPMKAELDTVRAAMDRQKLIVSEFPGLFSLEVKGLLPADTGDALRVKLNDLKALMAATEKSAIQDKLEGGVPPTPSGDQPKGPKELQKAMNEAFRAGKTDEYNKLADEYYKAIAKGDSK